MARPRSLTMTRASCLPLKKGAFNFSANRVFTLLENDGSESSVTLQHFGESTSEPSLAREKSTGKREQVRKLPFLLFHIYFCSSMKLLRTTIEKFVFISSRKLRLYFHKWKYSNFTLKSYLHSLLWSNIFLGGESVSWNTMDRKEAAICQLWKFYDFCFLIVFSRNKFVIIIMFWPIYVLWRFHHHFC